MAKQRSSDRVGSASASSRGLFQDLIDYLRHLIIVISSRLRHRQIDHSPMGDAKSDYDIWQRLGSHLEKVPVIEKPDPVKSPVTRSRTLNHPRHPRNTANAPMPAGLELKELRERNVSRAARQHLPRMSEQLQSKTIEHINIALILAKEGNQDGVKLHIDLANSAMHTASRFMSHEEYSSFEEKVESRVQSIIDSDRHDDSQVRR